MKAMIIKEFGGAELGPLAPQLPAVLGMDFAGVGFDVVYDTIGGPNLQNSFDAAALNAQVSTTVSLVELDLTTAHFKGLSLNVVFMLIPMLHNHKREVHGEVLATLAEIVDVGKLTPVLDELHFELADAGKAHDRLASGSAIGNLLSGFAGWFIFMKQLKKQSSYCAGSNAQVSFNLGLM